MVARMSVRPNGNRNVSVNGNVQPDLSFKTLKKGKKVVSKQQAAQRYSEEYNEQGKKRVFAKHGGLYNAKVNGKGRSKCPRGWRQRRNMAKTTLNRNSGPHVRKNVKGHYSSLKRVKHSSKKRFIGSKDHRRFQVEKMHLEDLNREIEKFLAGLKEIVDNDFILAKTKSSVSTNDKLEFLSRVEFVNHRVNTILTKLQADTQANIRGDYQRQLRDHDNEFKRLKIKEYEHHRALKRLERRIRELNIGRTTCSNRFGREQRIHRRHRRDVIQFNIGHNQNSHVEHCSMSTEMGTIQEDDNGTNVPNVSFSSDNIPSPIRKRGFDTSGFSDYESIKVAYDAYLRDNSCRIMRFATKDMLSLQVNRFLSFCQKEIFEKGNNQDMVLSLENRYEFLDKYLMACRKENADHLPESDFGQVYMHACELFQDLIAQAEKKCEDYASGNVDPSGYVYNEQYETESSSLNQEAQRTLDTEIAEEFSSLPANEASSGDEEMDKDDDPEDSGVPSSDHDSDHDRRGNPGNPSPNNSNKKSTAKSGKKTKKDKKKSRRSSSSSDDSDDSSYETEKLYRDILKTITKQAKYFKIKELHMLSDPSSRREKFQNWVLDLRNVLSCHYKTDGLLDSYPSQDLPMSFTSPEIDKAIKGLLSTITSGMAKRIVTDAKTAYDGLQDLKRNFGGSSTLDIHREKLKLMQIKQTFGEKASDYLRRVRKQMYACQLVGCQDYNLGNGSNALTGIILEGFDIFNRQYAATVAQQKSLFEIDPTKVNLITLEELFFKLDDKLYGSTANRPNKLGKKERAAAAQSSKAGGKKDPKSGLCFNCNQPGHVAKNCPKSNKSQKDLSHITCHKCKKKGHYANKCPQKGEGAGDKTVSFDLSHVAKEADEHCKMVTGWYDTGPVDECTEFEAVIRRGPPPDESFGYLFPPSMPYVLSNNFLSHVRAYFNETGMVRLYNHLLSKFERYLVNDTVAVHFTFSTRIAVKFTNVRVRQSFSASRIEDEPDRADVIERASVATEFEVNPPCWQCKSTCNHHVIGSQGSNSLACGLCGCDCDNGIRDLKFQLFNIHPCGSESLEFMDKMFCAQLGVDAIDIENQSTSSMPSLLRGDDVSDSSSEDDSSFEDDSVPPLVERVNSDTSDDDDSSYGSMPGLLQYDSDSSSDPDDTSYQNIMVFDSGANPHISYGPDDDDSDDDHDDSDDDHDNSDDDDSDDSSDQNSPIVFDSGANQHISHDIRDLDIVNDADSISSFEIEIPVDHALRVDSIESRKGEPINEVAHERVFSVTPTFESASIGDFDNWLLDSGATSHFTPYLSDLFDLEHLEEPIYIQTADGTKLKAYLKGKVRIKYVTDENVNVILTLQRVLYVPEMKSRLFSIESFISNENCSAHYSDNSVILTVPHGHRITIPLPHIPQAVFTAMPAIDPSAGASDENKVWLPSKWHEANANKIKKRKMNVELAHEIFGHVANTSLMNASHADVWDDIILQFNGDSWCDQCRIAVSKKHARSKEPMRFDNVPFKHLFIDLMQAPAVLKGVKGYNSPYFLLIVDPVSKYIDKINIAEKSTQATIDGLSKWRSTMVEKGFEVFIHLRSDAGTNFTSEEFKAWCVDNHITLTIAAQHHQEQNAFVEAAWQVVSNIGRKLLVHARLPLTFYHFAIDYAILILRVIPPKGLVDVDGNATTSYQVIHGKKPRVARYKVFGCPVVFKRYQPKSDTEIQTHFKQLQRGSRGTFVGFPKDQAGWLIYVPEKIHGSHLVVSQDVEFDLSFLSSITGTDKPFAQGQTERRIGGHSGRQGIATEKTGDIRHLGESQVTHWGDTVSYDTVHKVDLPSREPSEVPSRVDDEDHDNDSQSEQSDNNDSDEHDHFGTYDDEIEHEYSTRSRGTLKTTAPLEVKSGRRPYRKRQGKSSEVAGYILEESCNQVVNRYGEDDFKEHVIGEAFDEIEQVFVTLSFAAELVDIPVDPYIPEPRSLREIKQLPADMQKDWLKSVVKEIKDIIANGTFRRGEKPNDDDEIIPAMFIFKAKVTSRGFLDKLKARCVARGDKQSLEGDPDNVWSPCVFARTFKMFVADAVRMNKPIKQLDFINAFCQGKMRERLFLQLPKEWKEFVPEEYKWCFEHPQLLDKSIYGLRVSAMNFAFDVCEWLVSEKKYTPDGMVFKQSQIDPSLYIYRNGDKFIKLVSYVDDFCYTVDSEETEKVFQNSLEKSFRVEFLGHTHWFLGSRIYREEDGSYFIDQENYIRHVLNRYCSKEAPWGLPPMKDTPAPESYVYTKENRPKTDEEKAKLSQQYPGLSMPSAVSSLLYAALNSRPDILWITNKLAKSANCPGEEDFKALLHVFGYLRKYPDYGIKFYANIEDSPVYKLCKENKVEMSSIMGFSDSSWQDCPDTGRSTSGYKIFVQGGMVDANSTMPVPVALSSAEAEYMGACNAGAMISHLRELQYDLEYLGTPEYKLDGENSNDVPSILLVDNQATVRMSKNYKITNKNRHIRRRWHFVRQGTMDKLFKLVWIRAEDQLADDMTKTQGAAKILPNFLRTLLKIPDKIKGFKSNVVGNR